MSGFNADYGFSDLGTLPPDTLLTIKVNTESMRIEAAIQEQEETIDSLRDRIKAAEESKIETEIQNHLLLREISKLRDITQLSEDPTIATQQLATLNSIRLGLIPASSTISAETHCKTVEIFCKPVVTELAKDITKLGLFYDGLIHMASMVKTELNKVDVKTKIKIQHAAKNAEVEKIRTSPAPQRGQRKKSPEEKIILQFMKIAPRAGKTSVDEYSDQIFSLTKPVIGYLGDVKLAVLIQETISNLD